MTKQDSELKSRGITLPAKAHLVKPTVFSSGHVWMWDLDHKEGWVPKVDAFKLWCWRRLLRFPWTSRRSNQSILQEISPECSVEVSQAFFTYLLLLLYYINLSFLGEVKSLSRVWLCNPVDCSLPGSSDYGIIQARILESVAIFFSRRSSQPRDQAQGSNLGLWHWRQTLQILSHQGSLSFLGKCYQFLDAVTFTAGNNYV